MGLLDTWREVRQGIVDAAPAAQYEPFITPGSYESPFVSTLGQPEVEVASASTAPVITRRRPVSGSGLATSMDYRDRLAPDQYDAPINKPSADPALSWSISEAPPYAPQAIIGSGEPDIEGPDADPYRAATEMIALQPSVMPSDPNQPIVEAVASVSPEKISPERFRLTNPSRLPGFIPEQNPYGLRQPVEERGLLSAPLDYFREMASGIKDISDVPVLGSNMAALARGGISLALPFPLGLMTGLLPATTQTPYQMDTDRFGNPVHVTDISFGPQQTWLGTRDRYDEYGRLVEGSLGGGYYMLNKNIDMNQLAPRGSTITVHTPAGREEMSVEDVGRYATKGDTVPETGDVFDVPSYDPWSASFVDWAE